MQVERFFHIRTGDRNGGATVRVVGDTERIGQVDVQTAFCCKKDNYCRKTGRDTAAKAITKVVPLRMLGRELANIEVQALGRHHSFYRKHPDTAMEQARDYSFATRYFLPKE